MEVFGADGSAALCCRLVSCKWFCQKISKPGSSALQRPPQKKMKVDSSSAILISPRDYAIFWKIKLASHPVCVCVSECLWAWMCPHVGTRKQCYPGVCFIYSSLCLLLPGAVECTALGGDCREGKQRRPASQLLFRLPVKEKALCLCLASFEEDVFKG